MSKAQLVKTAVARDYDVSRQWVHELVRRYEADGAAAYVACSRAGS